MRATPRGGSLDLADHLKELRQRRGWSGRGLVGRAGLAHSIIFRLERAERRIKPSTLRRLSSVLAPGCPDVLVGCDSLPERRSSSSTGTQGQRRGASVSETGGRSGSGRSLKVGDGGGCCHGGWVSKSGHLRLSDLRHIPPVALAAGDHQVWRQNESDRMLGRQRVETR